MTTYRSAAAAPLAAAAPPAPCSPAVSLADLDGLPVVGVSLGHPDTAAAEHWLASLPSPPLLACTHLMRSPRPHVALSLVFADPVSDSATSPVFALDASRVTHSDGGSIPDSGAGPAPRSDAGPVSGAAEECPAAAAEHVARSSGRAVLYPGVERLVGTLSVAEILELSAIEKVEVLGGGAADKETLVDTGDFVRPQWRMGSLTLTTTPAADGHLVPFETRTPTPCCAEH